MSRQLTLDLPVRTALRRDDFFVSSANKRALNAVDGWPNWPGGKLLLVGPPGAGKTHLAHVWAVAASAQVLTAKDVTVEKVDTLVTANPRIALEDLDVIASDTDAQNAAFHLHNLALAEGGRLLMTSAQRPERNPMSLADLQSRMSGTACANLDAPDDALLSAVMVKLFADRQVEVPLNVITYLAPRIERSFEGAAVVVEALDKLALSRNRPISRTLAVEVMDNLPAAKA